MTEDRITISAFRAPENPGECDEFIAEHNRILEDFGIGHVTTNTTDWKDDRNVIVITIREEKLGMVGGMRIHCKYGRKAVLPLQDALAMQEPSIHTYADELAKTGVGELCALWNANRFGGRGLPYILGITGLAMLPQLQLQHAVGLVAKYTLRYARSVGFLINESMGDGGVFDYPRPGFWGIVIHCDDNQMIENAHLRWRQRIMSLRAFPVQIHLEQTASAKLHATYNLILKDGYIDEDTLSNMSKLR
jgi:hypothetical protein